ncbi:innexin inx2-like [Ornithodoros turicata]|uniref:innexin inx2-like n=1 Tax=Ornithodoros turicata TaxID=34597 RepID=UPI003138DA0A
MLSSFITLLTPWKAQKHINDDFTFRLHYRLTAFILLVFSIIVTSHQFFGNPIRCLSRNDVPTPVMDTYCWLQTTYSIVGAWDKPVGSAVPYPGVDVRRPSEKTVEHAYYQWVGFVLFLQFILFSIPRYLWKRVESGLIGELVLGLHNPIVSDEELNAKRNIIANYFKTHGFKHQVLFAAYSFCLLLQLLNVFGQAVLVDRLLDYQFTKFGISVVETSSASATSLTRIFPRMAKCNFYKYGSGGGVQTYDVVCLLPMNVLNEKVYVFLWFWFVLLVIVTSLSVMAYFVIAVSKSSRLLVFRFREGLQAGDELRGVISYFYVGDWFVLYLLSKNMDWYHFNECVEAVQLSCVESKMSRVPRTERRSKNVKELHV